jgi:hypothetical protein
MATVGWRRSCSTRVAEGSGLPLESRKMAPAVVTLSPAGIDDSGHHNIDPHKAGSGRTSSCVPACYSLAIMEGSMADERKPITDEELERWSREAYEADANLGAQVRNTKIRRLVEELKRLRTPPERDSRGPRERG